MGIEDKKIKITDSGVQYDRSGDTMRMVFCPVCDLVQLIPLPSSRGLAALYSDPGISSTMSSSSPRELDVTWDFFQKHVKFHKNQYLEIGAGEGVFAGFLAKRQLSVLCVEPNPVFYDQLKAKGFKCINTFFEDYHQENKVDTIIFRHVLEHVVDPVAFLQKVRSLLVKGGQIFLEVPNFLKLIEKTELALFPLFHLWNFNETILRKMLEKAGFENIIIYADEHIPVLRVIADHADKVSVGPLVDRCVQTGKVPKFIENYQKRRKNFIDNLQREIINKMELFPERQFVIHGAADHSIELLQECDITFQCIVDVSPFKQGKLFMGKYKILAPEMVDIDSSIVIVSSVTAADDIHQYWERRGLSERFIINPYN